MGSNREEDPWAVRSGAEGRAPELRSPWALSGDCPRVTGRAPRPEGGRTQDCFALGLPLGSLLYPICWGRALRARSPSTQYQPAGGLFRGAPLAPPAARGGVRLASPARGAGCGHSPRAREMALQARARAAPLPRAGTGGEADQAPRRPSTDADPDPGTAPGCRRLDQTLRGSGWGRVLGGSAAVRTPRPARPAANQACVPGEAGASAIPLSASWALRGGAAGWDRGRRTNGLRAWGVRERLRLHPTLRPHPLASPTRVFRVEPGRAPAVGPRVPEARGRFWVCPFPAGGGRRWGRWRPRG